MRACTIAPAHMGQGSKVTYSVQPSSRQLDSACAACVMAIISACAVGIAQLLALIVSRRHHALLVHDDRPNGHLFFRERDFGLAQRQTHEMLVHHDSIAIESSRRNARQLKWYICSERPGCADAEISR